jgi:phage-related protein
MTNSIYFVIPASSGIVASDTTINADKGATIQSTPRVKLANFGDGYEQRLADGINNIKREVNLTFSPRDNTEIDDIIDYFDYLEGVTPLTITYNNSNGNETMKVIIDNWTKSFQSANFSAATASGRRVYEA